MNRHNRLLIIGEPGTGKTTLTSFVAYTFATHTASTELTYQQDRIPMLMPIRELAKHIQGDASFHEIYSSIATKVWQAKASIEKWLTEGRCIVILDGLDEVPGTVNRIKVIKWLKTNSSTSTRTISSFLHPAQQVRKGRVLKRTFIRLELAKIDVNDILAFSKRWSYAVELALLRTAARQTGLPRHMQSHLRPLFLMIQKLGTLPPTLCY